MWSNSCSGLAPSPKHVEVKKVVLFTSIALGLSSRPAKTPGAIFVSLSLDALPSGVGKGVRVRAAAAVSALVPVAAGALVGDGGAAVDWRERVAGEQAEIRNKSRNSN